MKSISDDLKTALGQCFWIGLNGTDTSDAATQEIFHTFQPGGVILFQRNVQSISQVRKFNRDLQGLCTVPLFAAIDQEGGSVERLHKIIGTIPPAMALTAAGDGASTQRLHGAHARILRDLGFNVNFTPVLDLALTGADNGLGARCFSDKPETVVLNARDVILAHHREGVLACGKHFPGLGDTDLDSHIDLPVVARPWKRIEKEDLLPYRKLLPELPFIMVNHALYPEKNPQAPASLATEIVSELLLKKWKYRGLAVSDDLVMGAVSNVHNLSKAARLALLAGNHMFLICRPEGVLKAFRDLLAAVQKDVQLQEAVYRNATRILAQKFALTPPGLSSSTLHRDGRIMNEATELITQKSITLLRGHIPDPLPQTATLFLPRTKWIAGKKTAFSRELRKAGCRAQEYFYDMKVSQSDGDALAAATRTDWNIVVSTGLESRPGQKVLLQRLLTDGKRVILVHGAYPVPARLAEVELELATYWTAPCALAAAAAVLSGRLKPAGKLPIKSGGNTR